MKTLVFLITIIVTTTFAKTNEIIPIWNNSVGGGEIQDMEILPGGEQALILAGIVDSKFFFIDTETGETIREVPTKYFTYANFEITPDSTKIVSAMGSNYIEVRDIQTLELLGSANINRPDKHVAWISQTVVDPIRPVAYFCLIARRDYDNGSEYKSKIIAYNYETMEALPDITDFAHVDSKYNTLAISSDGKYLATINDGLKSYLKIWNLETNELIVNKALFDDFSDDRCEAYDIYFSKNENNIVYFSGMFTQKIHTNDKGSGLFRFNMEDGTRELMIPDAVYGSRYILFFDSDSRCISSTVGHIGILNVYENHIEYYNKPPTKVYSTIIKYSSKNDAFISSSFNNNISKFKYDRETNIDYDYEKEIIISPNPTHSTVNISIECIQPDINYSIYNTNGVMINQNMIENQQNNFIIDFSPYPTGVYFLSFICNNEQLVYKIVKEG